MSETKRRGPGRPFQPGQSGNPGGKPSSKWIRDYLAEEVPDKKGVMVSRRKAIIQSAFLAAIDSRRGAQQIRAIEILLAYEAGKPIQTVEMSGPDGGPIEYEGDDPATKLIRTLLARSAAKPDSDDDGSGSGSGG